MQVHCSNINPEQGSKLEFYYDEFVKRDWYKDKTMYDNQGRRITSKPAPQPTGAEARTLESGESEESVSSPIAGAVEEVELMPIPQGPAKLAFCKVDESVRATKCGQMDRPKSVKVIGSKMNRSIAKQFSSH